MERLKSCLEGAWVDGAGTGRELVHAVTGEVVATVSSEGLDLGAAVRAGRAAGASLRALTFAERGAILKRLSGAMHSAREALIADSVQGGTTRSDAKFDIDGAIGTLAWYAGLGRKLGDRKFLLDGEATPVLRSKRFVGQHIRLPRQGVAVHINAFNFPAWGMAEKVAVALLAGVPVITKPGTPTALLAERVFRLWFEAGFPDHSLQLLLGSAGDLLDHLGAQDCVAFTGGSATAARIRGHDNLVRHNVAVNIEADSLNASVLGPDVEPGSDTFEMFINQVSTDLIQKCGQKCTAVRRIFVPADKLDAVQDALIDRLDNAPVGDPSEKGVRIGPLASPAQSRAVAEGTAALDAVADKVWVGADIDGPGCYQPPTLFRIDADDGTGTVHEHEVFGPVATLLGWDGQLDGLVERVSAGGGGLVCSVYSDDVGWGGDAVLALAPWHGRIHWGSRKVHDQSPGPGTVLPDTLHGGPGKAGGGAELGGARGLEFYMPRAAIQADQNLLRRVLERAGG